MPAAPKRPQPGDPGIAPAVLDPAAFSALPGMQPGADAAQGRDTAPPREPQCEWQKHSAPYQPDPRYSVTYYYNQATGASTYDKPKEYAEWEAAYEQYLAATVK